VIFFRRRPFFPKLVNFLSSGPVVAMVWEGKEVVKYGRTMIGVTNPLASAPGTIRGDFGIDVGRNIIHGSDSVEVRLLSTSPFLFLTLLNEIQIIGWKSPVHVATRRCHRLK
jgi:hypothetical protein